MRATIIALTENPTELAAARAWLSRWQERGAYVSADQGCGCCTHIWNVDAPSEALAELPDGVRAASDWSSDANHDMSAGGTEASQDEAATVYVALRGEGTEVWRPVLAEPIAGMLFRLVSSTAVPDDEDWEFAPGTLVRCVRRALSSGPPVLVAVEQISLAS